MTAGALRARVPVSDAAWLAGLALALRALLVVWAKDRFPPADDGSFYQVVAERIAQGQGYTWRWPDGVVTYAAHYPVGYPALLGLAYALFGSHPGVAMAVNAALGALATFAAQRVVARQGTRRQAFLAGALLALHPGLFFYTPALMTEGVAAELLVVAAWLALRVGSGRGQLLRLVTLGVCTGFLTLLRPQLLILAPAFGFFSGDAQERRLKSRVFRALSITAMTLAVCLPWTLRNCARMDRCVFVSANGGWNLLIGAAPEGQGAWVPIEGALLPKQCREVYGEAEKDRCFGQAAVAQIRRNVWAYLALVPRKLSLTFDYFGAPGHYLQTSNAAAFGDESKWRLGVVETGCERLILLVAILNGTRVAWEKRHVRVAGALAGLATLLRSGWLGYLGFVLVVALSAKQLLKHPLLALTAVAVLTTAITHAVFFGAGRYGFVCAGLLCVAASGVRSRPRSVSDGTPPAPAQ